MSRPKVGLALGSGGARGMAHIGVIKVLEDEGIPIDYISGSSMGSLVGAFYASGMKPDMMKKLAIHLKRKYWLDFTVPKLGFICGEKIKEMVKLLTREKNFEDMNLPFAVVATDLEKGERVVFNQGPVYEAVRASISIPGIFVPAVIDGRHYVDGGVMERVPITVAKQMGADVVIGVDVGAVSAQAKWGNIFDIIAQSIEIMEREIFKYRTMEADIMVRPQVEKYSATAFTQIEELIAAGEQAALRVMEEIKQVTKAGGLA